MNIMLQATSVTTSTYNKEDFKIEYVRGCNRNEDCVYLNDRDHIVYELTDNYLFNREQFIKDVLLFSKDRINSENAGYIYDLIEREHKEVEVKDVSHYAKNDAEKIALTVLRENGNCSKNEFIKHAFDVALKNDFEKGALKQAIRDYA